MTNHTNGSHHPAGLASDALVPWSAPLPFKRPDRLPDVVPSPPGQLSTHVTRRPGSSTSTGSRRDRPTGSPSTTAHGEREGLGVDWVESRILLGPDWKAIAGFTAFVASLVGGAALGEVLASATGGLAGAMTAAGLVAVVTYRRNKRRLAEVTGIPADWHDDETPSTESGFDSVLSTDRPASSSRDGEPTVSVFVWVCSDCDLRSTPTLTWVEARHLAVTHDRVHHGTRPAAAIESRQLPTRIVGPGEPSWLTTSALSAQPGYTRQPGRRALRRGPSGEGR